MDTSFIEKLRMANIFPADGGVRQGTPFGMPDLNAGMVNPDLLNRAMSLATSGDDAAQAARVEQAQKQLATSGYRKPALEQIASQAAQPQKQVVYQPSMSDYQKAQIELGRQRLGQQGELGEQRIGVSRTNTAIAARRADLAEKIASGRATDAEKQEYAIELIHERGGVQSGLIGERGANTLEQIGARLAGQKELLGTRGEQALTNIAARGKEQRTTDAAKPISASQVGDQQDNILREVSLTDPNLSQYIIEGEDGRLQLKPGAPLTVVTDIKNRIYGKATKEAGDINLPSTTTAKPSASKQPTVQSKYKVTVR